MEFKDCLRRYHVAPLRYDDGKELSEGDYKLLFVFLKKYYAARFRSEGLPVPEIPAGLEAKAEKAANAALFPLSIEDFMDIYTNQQGGCAL